MLVVENCIILVMGIVMDVREVVEVVVDRLLLIVIVVLNSMYSKMGYAKNNIVYLINMSKAL